MITLYVKTGCPFCAKVLEVMSTHNVPFEEKNISDPEVVAELIELGGKRQVPFVDDDNMTPYIVDDDVEMYESDDIVAYIAKKYGKETTDTSDIKVHVADDSEVCETKE